MRGVRFQRSRRRFASLCGAHGSGPEVHLLRWHSHEGGPYAAWSLVRNDRRTLSEILVARELLTFSEFPVFARVNMGRKMARADMSQQHMGHDHMERCYAGHDHSAMVADFRRRFWVSTILTIPVLALSPLVQSLLGLRLVFTGDSYVLFVLSAIVYFYGGWPFLK